MTYVASCNTYPTIFFATLPSINSLPYLQFLGLHALDKFKLKHIIDIYLDWFQHSNDFLNKWKCTHYGNKRTTV